MTTLYNVTEARGKLTQIGEKIKPGTSASFLKNGKILFVGIAKKDFEEYQKYKEEQKWKQWENSLPIREATPEEEEAFEKAENEKSFRPMSAKQVMELL